MKATQHPTKNVLADALWESGRTWALAAIFAAMIASTYYGRNEGFAAVGLALMFYGCDHDLITIPSAYARLCQLQFLGLLGCFTDSRAAIVYYGNFCLTMLVISTFGSVIALYLEDSTPD